ncbi:hypothetical protein FOCC_FOCC014208 [Frankliniella occidentalis]|nr:hypothetical protein FOCC_FOCC014208 [Frankliniella occidentalis]
MTTRPLTPPPASFHEFDRISMEIGRHSLAVLVLSVASVVLMKQLQTWKDMSRISDEPVVLATGGAGFIGSHIVVELLNNGFSVVVIDNLVNALKGNDGGPKPESLRRVEKITNKTVTFYNVDLLDIDALKSVFLKHNIVCVIHFAALKAVGESCEIPLTYYKNNVMGSINLLEVMKEFNVKKLLFSSSATVYGLPQKLPLTEDHPTGQGCTNPYGKTKYFIEEILQDLCASDKTWSVVALRYFNPIGAHKSGLIGEDPNGIPSNLMPYIAQVATGKRAELKVYGNDYDTLDGTGVRDYIHIVDLAEGHISGMKKVMDKAFSGWRVYNLGTGTGYSVLQIVHEFESASGKKVPYSIVERRPGDVASSYADPTRAKKELQWTAKRTLSDMCKFTKV